jgi:hypothetical protein
MYKHTCIHVSSYCCICVLILLYVSSYCRCSRRSGGCDVQKFKELLENERVRERTLQSDLAPWNRLFQEHCRARVIVGILCTWCVRHSREYMGEAIYMTSGLLKGLSDVLLQVFNVEADAQVCVAYKPACTSSLRPHTLAAYTSSLRPQRRAAPGLECRGRRAGCTHTDAEYSFTGTQVQILTHADAQEEQTSSHLLQEPLLCRSAVYLLY